MSKNKRKKRTGNRSDYYKMCGKKNRYGSPETALYAAQKAFRERGEKLHVYKERCPYCGKWHIGH